jgi:hypothetical protein
MTMVINNCLGKLMSLETFFSDLMAECLNLSNCAGVKEKYAVSDPEKKADKARSNIKRMM